MSRSYNFSPAWRLHGVAGQILPKCIYYSVFFRNTCSHKKYIQPINMYILTAIQSFKSLVHVGTHIFLNFKSLYLQAI
jgi:hypothetical protein